MTLKELRNPFTKRLDKLFNGEYFTEEELLKVSEPMDSMLEEIKEGDHSGDESSLYVPPADHKLDLSEEKHLEDDESEKKEAEKIEFSNALLFSDDSGNIHVLDIQNYINEYELKPTQDQTKRSNYFPYRSVKQNSNGMFSSREELYYGFNVHSDQRHTKKQLNDLSELYHTKWNVFEDIMSLFSLISIPKKLIVVASGYTYIKIYSVFGELL